MATEPHARPGSGPEAAETEAYVSPIENELPSYRAISPMAVGSLIFGLLSALAYADLKFTIAAVIAIGLGAIALLRIRKQPDVLTGAALAQVGLALGLIFGLSAATITYTQIFLLKQRAEAFVRQEVVPVLNERDLDGALWFRLNPDERRGLSGAQVRAKFADPGNPDPMAFEMSAGPVVTVAKLLEEHPEAQVAFGAIEQTEFTGITPTVLARLEIQQYEPESVQNDLERVERTSIGILLKSQGGAQNESWWVDDYVYPYKPESYEPKVPSIEEEHGHGHAH